MGWSHKWRESLRTGQYYDLLARGFFENKPEAIEPNVDGLHFYLEAFRELSSCRPGGMDVQAIPFTAVAEYCRVYGIEDFDDFLYIIRQLDSVYLGLVEAESKKKGTESAAVNDNKNSSNTGRRGG